MKQGPIGIFDSGYGGLTILKEIRRSLPQYDYLYLGDNARAPYGVRSFDIVYQFTLQAVEALMSRGCNLIILACNTASAKALRAIQQNDLPKIHQSDGENLRRVLGVIIPSVEALDKLSVSKHIGVLATNGTVASGSYSLETAKTSPHIKVTEEPCPMWVPLVENGEFDTPGADYFVKKKIDAILEKDPEIDTLLLGCTHYPILIETIKRNTPEGIRIVAQGDLIAKSLKNYLDRHPEIEEICSKGGRARFLTTENEDKFADLASLFLGHSIEAEKIVL